MMTTTPVTCRRPIHMAGLIIDQPCRPPSPCRRLHHDQGPQRQGAVRGLLAGRALHHLRIRRQDRQGEAAPSSSTTRAPRPPSRTPRRLLLLTSCLPGGLAGVADGRATPRAALPVQPAGPQPLGLLGSLQPGRAPGCVGRRGQGRHGPCTRRAWHTMRLGWCGGVADDDRPLPSPLPSCFCPWWWCCRWCCCSSAVGPGEGQPPARVPGEQRCRQLGRLPPQVGREDRQTDRQGFRLASPACTTTP